MQATQSQRQHMTPVTSPISTTSTNSMLLLATNDGEKKSRELPYQQLRVITLDSNQNYKKCEGKNGTVGRNRHNSMISAAEKTTVIPNYYSIREEMKRELQFNKQVRFIANFYFFKLYDKNK